MKNLLTLFIFFSGYLTLQATDIKGRIIDANTKEPIEFATTILLKSDSTYVTGSQTDLQGLFAIAGQFTKQTYLLKATFMGYRTTYIELQNISKGFDMGDIELSEDAKLLGEVTVTGQRVINKVDRKIMLPDSMQIKSSVNAFDLIGNMSFPGLNIDPVNRTIKVRNEEVQLRINGVRASIEEVVALLSSEILRVEFFEDPGVRFGDENVGAVLNLIVQRGKNHGGYVALDARNAPFVGFGNDNLTFKSNYKDSEFSLNYYVDYRKYSDRWSDKTETFNLPSGSITREHKGEKAPMEYQYHNANLAYNLTKPDKYVFNVVLKNQIFTNKNQSIYNTQYLNDNSKTVTQTHNKGANYMPVLDLFFRREMKNKQSIAINMVGTYVDSENKSRYLESSNTGNPTDIFNKVEGNRYSVIGEAVYNKEFEKMTFSSGIKHTQGYSDNVYDGTSTRETNMGNADSYIFAQIQGKLFDKVGYTLGLGGSRAWYKEGNNDATYYSLRPAVQVSYNFNDNFSVKYSLAVHTRNPSLAQKSSVEQQQDNYQISRGNPDLKPYNAYRNRLGINYSKGIFSINSDFGYMYFPKIAVSTYSVEGDKIISYTDNHKSENYYYWSNEVGLKLIKDVWSIDGWMNMHHDVFNGNDSKHSRNTMNYGMRSNVQIKNYSFAVGMQSRYSELWGETVYYGDDWNYIEAGYKHKEAKFSLGMSYPLSDYWSSGSKSKSKAAPAESWTYIAGNGQMLYARFSWNISFGRKHQAGAKSLDNVETEKGI